MFARRPEEQAACCRERDSRRCVVGRCMGVAKAAAATEYRAPPPEEDNSPTLALLAPLAVPVSTHRPGFPGWRPGTGIPRFLQAKSKYCGDSANEVANVVAEIRGCRRSRGAAYYLLESRRFAMGFWRSSVRQQPSQTCREASSSPRRRLKKWGCGQRKYLFVYLIFRWGSRLDSPRQPSSNLRLDTIMYVLCILSAAHVFVLVTA